MSTVLEQQLQISCAQAQAIAQGLGLEGCKIDLDQIKAFGLIRRSFVFAPETQITKASLRTMQLNRDLFVFQNVVNAVDNTAENTTQEIENTGINRNIRRNPISLSFNFENGYSFAKKLPFFDSFDSFDIVIFDKKNTMWLTKPKSDVKGLRVGMIATTPYKGSDGATLARSGMTIQLLEEEEWNKYLFPIPSNSLDFLYSDLTDVNDVVIDITPPAALATEFTFKASLLSDRNAPQGFNSIQASDLRYKVNGVVTTITNITNTGDGQFTATVPAVALNDTLTLESFNSTTNKGIVQVGNILYNTPVPTTAVVV